MLRYLVEKTYEFRFEDEDYSSLLEAIDAIDARFGSFDEDGKTKGEKAEFWAELAEALRGLVDLVDETDGARTHFEGYVETLALSAERTEAAVNR